MAENKAPEGRAAVTCCRYENAQDRAKHQTAKQWVAPVNHWHKLGACAFQACNDPQMSERELQYLACEQEKKRG